ncbi:amino acid transporter [Dacryopinax primogenitus]|uniref:Amino acid transporter n=1 Tax=Dacryopinax primogenitus (strain DJM 731) TaxID=1858805 RepID=M5G5K3_DACPD|nr:amino acid transporter [Dacryopinax primogenitus]EJU03979.1 amino acid transporter [Dacryopinax primogenitus]
MARDDYVESPPESPIDEAEEVAELAAVPGAPVERHNPLGHNVTLLSAINLNFGQILGHGIFSMGGAVLASVGSVGLYFTAWILAPLLAYVGLMVYSELSSYFPLRSGGSVVYLEQQYPRPKFFVPIVFAVTSTLLAYHAVTAIVFAQYWLVAFSLPITSTSQTVVAIIGTTVTSAIALASTKWSLRIVNVFSIFKVLSLIFVVITGIVVLLGLTHIKDPWTHFQHPWANSNWDLNGLANTLIKTNTAVAGWHNAFFVLGEVRSHDPVRVVSRAGYISLSITIVLYLLTNVAYIAVVPPEEIKASGQLVGALFFKHVFGESAAAKILPIMVTASCFGNMIAVVVGSARVLREIARQGLLPWPAFWSTSHPFGTPSVPIIFKWFLSVLVILLLPAKDAFNFLLDLASYPFLVFGAAFTFGIWPLRERMKKMGLPKCKYEMWDVFIVLVPPEDGQGDVSFWYGTYCVVGMGVLLFSALFYYVYIVYLPKRGGYEIVEEIEDLPDGARNARLVRRYKAQEASTENEPLLS